MTPLDIVKQDIMHLNDSAIDQPSQIPDGFSAQTCRQYIDDFSCAKFQSLIETMQQLMLQENGVLTSIRKLSYGF